MTAITIYTCATGNYDWIHRPRVMPPGVEFVRFSDRKPARAFGWTHRALPSIQEGCSPRVASRFPKLCPHSVLPYADIAIWIDSSVEVLGDLRPAIATFIESDADVALFPHPSGRTVAEELDFAIRAGRIAPRLYNAAEQQRERYRAAGVLDAKVVEATIIFYRLPSEALRAAGEAWWSEIVAYTERDQVSQPFAMRDEALKLHYWDWHFDAPNPFFRRLPHRPKTIMNRLRTGAHFLAESRLDYRMVRYAINAARQVRRTGRALLSLSK